MLFSLLKREVFHILFWHGRPSHHFNVRYCFLARPSDWCWTCRPATCVVVNASVAFKIYRIRNFALPWWLTYWHRFPILWLCFIVVVNVSALLRPFSLYFVVSSGLLFPSVLCLCSFRNDHNVQLPMLYALWCSGRDVRPMYYSCSMLHDGAGCPTPQQAL